MTAKRILVVDDEPSIVEMITRVLEDEGFEVRGTTRGLQALDLYHQEKVDLALVDLNMPDACGLDVLVSIRARHPDAAIIIFTGYGTKEREAEAFRLGARAFLEKPISIETLVRTIRHTLQQTQGDADNTLVPSLKSSPVARDRQLRQGEVTCKPRTSLILSALHLK